MSRPRNILVVEDNPADQKLIKLALDLVDKKMELHFAQDGMMAWDYLEEHTSSLPDLIILDQNMPRMNGFELLNAIRGNEQFRHIKVAMFSTTPLPRWSRHPTPHRADTYLTKPFDIDEYTQVIASLCHDQIENVRN